MPPQKCQGFMTSYLVEGGVGANKALQARKVICKAKGYLGGINNLLSDWLSVRRDSMERDRASGEKAGLCQHLVITENL